MTIVDSMTTNNDSNYKIIMVALMTYLKLQMLCVPMIPLHKKEAEQPQ